MVVQIVYSIRVFSLGGKQGLKCSLMGCLSYIFLSGLYLLLIKVYKSVIKVNSGFVQLYVWYIVSD